MKYRIFDTHAHYDDEKFNEDRESVIEEIQKNGVIGVLNAGASLEGCIDSVKLANENDMFYASVGIHPSYADKVTDEVIEKLKELSQNKKVKAIGEIGLDYYYEENPSREIQKEAFRKQCISLGYYIGFTGVLTFKNAKKLVEVCESIPLDRMLVETDCPYMAPTPNRGKRNQSDYIQYIIEKICEIRGLGREEIQDILLENTKRRYKIDIV